MPAASRWMTARRQSSRGTTSASTAASRNIRLKTAERAQAVGGGEHARQRTEHREHLRPGRRQSDVPTAFCELFPCMLDGRQGSVRVVTPSGFRRLAYSPPSRRPRSHVQSSQQRVLAGGYQAGGSADSGAGPIDQFLDAVWMERGLSPNTLAAYRADLTALARWLDDSGSGLLTASRADLLAFMRRASRPARGPALPRAAFELPPLLPASGPGRHAARGPDGADRHAEGRALAAEVR